MRRFLLFLSILALILPSFSQDDYISFDKYEFQSEYIYEYDRALELNPNDADAYFCRGCVYLTYTMFEEAIKDFTKVIELDFTPTDAYLKRGIAYGSMGRLFMALDDFDMAILTDLTDHVGYYARAIVYHEKGFDNLALADLDRATRLNSEFHAAYLLKADIYNENDDIINAIQNYTYALRLKPENDVAYNKRDELLRIVSTTSITLEDFDNALETTPAFSDAYFDSEYMLSSADDISQAEPYYKQVIKRDYKKAKKPDYKKAKKHDNNNPYTFVTGGDMYHKSNEYHRVIDDYTTSVVIDADRYEAYPSREYSYSEINEYDRAVTDSDRALGISPDVPLLFENRACNYVNPRLYDAPDEVLDEEPETDTDFRDQSEPLTYLERFKYKSDLELSSSAIKSDPTNPILYYNRGVDYINLQNYASALDDFMKVLELESIGYCAMKAKEAINWLERNN